MKIILRNGETYVPFYRPMGTSDLWERLSREIWDSWSPFVLDARLLPGIEISEQKGNLVVKTELPGFDKKDLDISVRGNQLTIRGEKTEKSKKGDTRRNGGPRHTQYFQSVTLPYPVKEEQTEAKFNRGILELHLPKGEEVKPRKIEIKARLPGGKSNKPELKPGTKKS
jgi:HSP20 family molecular chaperone IbpA